MNELGVGVIVFVCLAGASLGALFVFPTMAARHRDDDTNAVVRHIANIFVVMASLVFGLMINSAKNTFEHVDRSLHEFATTMILFDRTLRAYGPPAAPARERLAAYAEITIAQPTRADGLRAGLADRAGQALDAVGEALRQIQPADGYRESLLLDVRQQFRRVVEQRWAIVEQSEGTIAMPLIWLLVAWLSMVFASFGYRAPRNEVVIASFLAAALLISAAFYLVLDMDLPFEGPIQVADAPLHRALAEMKR